jgi:putative ABC transport system permease protein
MSVDELAPPAPASNGAPVPANGAKDVTIVGILADTYAFGRTQPPPRAVLVPYTLRASAFRTLVVKTAVEPAGLLNEVRRELRALDKEQPMLTPLTFEQVIQEQLQQPRFNLALLGLLAAIALVLAAAGIYSVLSYAVAQRTREIGVRMALGADRPAVLRLFVGLGARLVAIGLAIGTAVSIALVRVASSSRVFNGTTFDAGAVALAVAALGGAAMLASYVPARRAAKVDPIVALRAE